MSVDNRKLNFLVCADCQGRGHRERGVVCQRCHGQGVTLLLGNQFLYWGASLDQQSVVYEKVIKKVQLIINLALGVLGLSGLILMGYRGYLDNFQSFFSLTYWLTPGPEKVYFWLTLLLDLYLYYRLEQTTALKFSVRRQRFGERELAADVLPPPAVWPTTNLLDVSSVFTAEARAAVQATWELAQHFQHHEIGRIHLLAVLFQFHQSAIIMARLGINFEVFKQKVGRFLGTKILGRGGEPVFDEAMRQTLLLAYWVAAAADKQEVDLLDLTLALASPANIKMSARDIVEDICLEFDVNYQKIKNVVAWVQTQEVLRSRLQRFRGRARYKPKSGLDRALTAVATPYLNQFSEDLTLAARQGNFFPCIGREKELEQMFRIFETSRQGVLLVGPIGIGKTALIAGLAERMVTEDVPEILRDKRLVSLNINALIAGVSIAVAEERLITIVNEVIEAGNVVVVVENLPHLYGQHLDSAGGLDLAEVFAELLAKGLFYCLATTTPEGFATAIENKNLDAVFQVVRVEELTTNDAILVLEAQSGPIEYKNQVYFSYGAIEKAVVLSSRYIADHYLPGKAIEILEQAAIKVKKERGENKMVQPEDVAEVITVLTKIPLTTVTEKESEKLLHLEEKIHERLVGQAEAVKVVATSLRRARAGLKSGSRPIAGVLFLGPTGVGKTELAKSVAEVYFGNEKNMVRFDMSEYQLPGSLERLIGQPATRGQLTEAIRRQPFSLILFDEVEKAHADILNLFLQILDEGRLTDAQGRLIDFTNTIIIMTANTGAVYIQDEINKGTALAEIKKHLLNNELRQHFRPELLNRFDGIIVFQPLSLLEVMEVTRRLLNKIVKKLADKGIDFRVSDEAVAELAELGFDPQFGARPLRRVIEEHVDNTLADYLLRGELKRRDNVTLAVGGKLKIEKAAVI